MSYPLLYEINTRCWLRALSDQAGRAVTLANLPDAEFDQWQRWGLTHLWLMGIWTGGPRARAEALATGRQRQAYADALPDLNETDVVASPYAIAEYTVPPGLGGEEGLAKFRDRLHAHGMKLVLDFVPNHLGLDHPWAHDRPELFVQSPTGDAASPNPDSKARGTFAQETASGTRWLAHGKDPYFPPWSDTIQLDYRRADTREAMTGLLRSVARRCDGVRCDMAMLLLSDIFARTWSEFPVVATNGSLMQKAANDPTLANRDTEFWASAVAAIKAEHPDFLFLAEAYWGTEARLQALGFNYTYDKALYDILMARDAPGVQQHLLDLPRERLVAGAHFLENHDERRVADVLSLSEHRAAALVVLGLPGLRFLHEGQLSGARRRVPVQLARRPVEPVQAGIKEMYDQLLATLNHSAVGQGTFELLRPRPAWPDNPTTRNFVIVQWQRQSPEFDLVVVNLASHRSQCYAPLAHVAEHSAWSLQDQLGTERYQRTGEELQQKGLYLDLPPHSAQLFHFQPA